MTTASPTTDRLEAVSRTARWTAAARARESRRPDRLFVDPFAEELSGSDGHELLFHFHPEHASDDGNPYLPIRTHWFDLFLQSRAQEGQQIVGIGAGLDVRAYRLDWPAGTRIFEVDQASVLGYKQAVLERDGRAPRCERVLVPAELSPGWEQRLLAAGFDPARPTLWFAEGLVYYLEEDQAQSVLDTVRGLSAPGSTLAVDIIGRGIFRLPYMREFLTRLEEANSPWIWGTDDPVALLRDRGFGAVDVVEPGDPGANFGRWPGGGTPAVPNVPRMYLSVASA